MRLNEHFDVREFVAKEVYDEFGAEFCKRFVNPTLLNFLVWLKLEMEKKYKCEISVRVNDWHYGGSFQNRGFRHPKSTVGKWTSAHRLCMGVDSDFKKKDTKEQIPIAELSKFILDHEEEVLKMGITRIEDVRDTPTWLHVDCLYTGKPNIQIVRP
jgi:hypothetical protein